MNQWFMMMVELLTCCVPKDPSFSTPMEGYMVTFAAFYERGFSVPSHRFLDSLLQHYDLELHNLIASGVLHIATFTTLCKAYLGIEPPPLSYPVFMPKPSTHRIHDPESIVPHIQPKVFTDNQMSRIKYIYYIDNISKDYDDSQ
jgi:hypothetical protein